MKHLESQKSPVAVDRQPLDDDQEEKELNKFIKEVSKDFTDNNKRFKLTIKKKYVNEILMQSKGA